MMEKEQEKVLFQVTEIKQETRDKFNKAVVDAKINRQLALEIAIDNFVEKMPDLLKKHFDKESKENKTA